MCLARVRQEVLRSRKTRHDGRRKGEILSSPEHNKESAGIERVLIIPILACPVPVFPLNSAKQDADPHTGLRDGFIALKICKLVPLCSFFSKRGMHFGC